MTENGRRTAENSEGDNGRFSADEAALNDDLGSAETQSAELLDRVRALLSEKLSISVNLAEKAVPLEALQSYSLGSVIVFKDTDPQRLRLSVEGTPIAEGTVVQVGDKLGLRLDRVLTNRDKLDALFPRS